MKFGLKTVRQELTLSNFNVISWHVCSKYYRIHLFLALLTAIQIHINYTELCDHLCCRELSVIQPALGWMDQHGLCICSLENVSWMSPHPFFPHSLRWQFHWQRGTTQDVSGWRGNTSAGMTPSVRGDSTARCSRGMNSVCQRLYDRCSETGSAGAARL